MGKVRHIVNLGFTTSTLNLSFKYNLSLKIIRYNYENPCFVRSHFRKTFNYTVRTRWAIWSKDGFLRSVIFWNDRQNRIIKKLFLWWNSIATALNIVILELYTTAGKRRIQCLFLTSGTVIWKCNCSSPSPYKHPPRHLQLSLWSPFKPLNHI
jgi:hypothetical protein